MQNPKRIILTMLGVVVILVVGFVWYFLINQKVSEQLQEFLLLGGGTAKLDARCTDKNFREANSDVVIVGNVNDVGVKVFKEIGEKQRKTPPYEVDRSVVEVDYNFITISVAEYLKGAGPQKFVLKYRTSLPVMPGFQRGENVKLYLVKTTNGYEFMCGDLGKELVTLTKPIEG